VLSRCHPGATTVAFPCGWRNPLCLQAFDAPFHIRHWFLRLGGAFLVNPILLPGEPAPLGKAWAGAPPGSGGDKGVLLFVRQRRAVTSRSRTKSRPPIPLFRGLRVSWFDPEAPPLLPAS
jgi:hypothetical protein